jgi:hypothetical protein
VALASDPSLLLFVGGDPRLADSLGAFPRSFPRILGFVVPPTLLMGSGRGAPPRAAEAPWLIPSDQLMASERLSEALRGSHRTVKVVDVNQPGEDRALVERYLTSSDVLPVLVRADGARLEGANAFTRSNLRAFLGAR